MRRYRLIFLFIIFTNQLYTQVNYCNINQNDTNICIGNSLTLSASANICQNYSNLLNLSDKSIKAVYEVNDTIYIAGIFTGILNIGSYSFISYGMQDVFIAKLNSCSEVIWANHIGSSNDDDVTELYVQNNNLFVSGSYWNSTLSINHINGTNTIPNNGKLDGFLINFNIYNGSYNWDISVRANSNESCRDVTLDDFGNIYLVGSFNGCCPSSFSAMVYSSNNTSLSLTTNSYSSGYLVKIDASGTPLWSTIGYNRDFDNTTVTSLNGYIYVGSNFRSWNFGTSATINANNGTFSIYNPGIGLSCLIKYDTNGNLMWSRSIGNSGAGAGGATHINDLISNQGRISVTGTYYSGTCIFYENTGSVQSSLNSAEGVDGFYGEYNEDGSLNFSYRISGLDDEIPKRIYQNSDSTCIISGYYNNNIFYNGQTISSNGSYDMFITEINTSSYMSYLDSYGSVLDDYIFAFDLYDNNQTSIFGGEISSGSVINNDTANFNGGFIYNSNQISNTLLWSTGDTSASIVINPTQTNTYWLQSFYNGSVICTDSILVTVSTSIDTFFNNILACDSYTWSGVTYDTTGVYYNTYVNAVGCDSVSVLNLTIVNSNTGLSTATACDLYNWNGLIYTASGIYTQSIINTVGCDSIHTLDLTINSSNQTYSSVTSCNSHIWDGVIYTNSGIYTNTYTNIFGCDSTHTLDLIINSSDQTSSSVTSCDYYIWNGLTYTTSGIYTQNMVNTNGCDSIHTLNITIVNSNTGFSTVTACDSYNWNGLIYTVSGIYTQAIVNAVGCDSIHTLDLTINYSSQTSSSVTSCDSFTWDGITYTTTGVYMHIYINSSGCDSIHTLNLTINNTNQTYSSIFTCNSYTWDGLTYTSSGIYTNVYTNVSGCDSIHTLDLTINYSSQTSSSILACDSYTWDGITYTTTGVYMNIYINSSGCDSVHTLNLTINNTDQTSSSVTACNFYVWDGETYTTSGIHTNIYTNIAGCDSTHTLELIINYSDTIYNQYNICYGDSIVIGDSTHYTAGNFINIFTASNGCDSIIFDNINIDSQLVVSIIQIDSIILANVSGGVQPYSYQWNTGEDSSQISFSSHSSYWVVVVDSNNCISDTAFYKPNQISNTYITDLLIFPNPSENIFYIEFYTKFNQEVVLDVIDNIGRKIYNKGLFVSQGTVKTQLNLYNIRRGIYYLQIKIGEDLIYKKLILK